MEFNQLFSYSLIRLQKNEWKEGQTAVASGVLKLTSQHQIVLKGQGIEISFYYNERSKDLLKKSASFKKGDHISITFKFKKNKYEILSLKKILTQKKETLFWSKKKSEQWFLFLREVEDFFLSSGLCPVETPTLVSCPGTEPHLDFFSTEIKLHQKKQKMWLASSPEIHLKKILCRGGTDIFEIHKSYRNGEEGPLHLSEFYLLEWYRAYGSLELLVEDIKNLLDHLKLKNWIAFEIKDFQNFSVQELFKKYLKFDLTPCSHAKQLIPLLKKYSIPFHPQDSFESFFHLLFLNIIEPKLDIHSPTIIYNYPPSLRAYSKLSKEGWAERFELYWKGVELANAFFEVTDSSEQKNLFKNDLKLRKEKPSIDLQFLKEMDAGMPPCSGIALGLERLFMVIQELKDIQGIKPFYQA